MKEKILQVLKENSPEYVSGELLCRRLGVSRTAVWKHINALKTEGYTIEARTNVGYRLLGVPDRLYEWEVQEGLNTTHVGRKIFHFERLASTNLEADRLGREGCPGGAVVVAEEQTGGMGRMGRGWFSPHGKGLWFSILLRPPVGPAEVPQLTLVTAVAVARAVRAAAGVDAGIKWPNDILVNGKKLCGILTELNAETDQINYTVVGVGLNVNITDDLWPADIAEIATSLQIETGEVHSRCRLMKSVLEEFESYYFTWLGGGFKVLLDEWRKMCVILGRPVRVTTVRETLTGRALDVDETGALVLELPGGERRRLLAGDVSLRAG